MQSTIDPTRQPLHFQAFIPALLLTLDDGTVIDLQAQCLDAFALAYGYKEQIPDPSDATEMIPNPATTFEFANAVVVRFIQEVGRAHFVKQASAGAALAAGTLADNAIMAAQQIVSEIGQS